MKKQNANGGYSSREDYLLYHRNYYEKNKERILKRKKSDPWGDRIKNAKERSCRYNVPFDIDREYLNSIMTEFCPALEIKLSYIDNTTIKDNSATIDRIVPELGYVKGNIQILSHKANRMKTNATRDELVAFAQWIMRSDS